MAKNLSFSYSKMGMYKECPQKYKFRYVHMIPELPKYYFAFGSILHSVMEFVFDPSRQFFPTLSEALSYFDKEWSKTTWEQKGYASVDKELAGYAEGRREIEAYYAKNSATFIHPLSVEMRSTLEIDGISLISILDRLDYLGDGQVKILDYKTGKTVQREPDQLYMYQKVVETSPVIKALVQQKDPSVKEIKVGQLAFYHLPSLTEMTFERAPDNEIATFWQQVLSIANNIRAGKFSPTPGENQCRWCDYRNICPVFTGREYMGPSGADALPLLKGQQNIMPTPSPKMEKPKELAKTPQEVLSNKIDQYGLLIEQLEQLKNEIIDLMKQQQFSRHFGARYKAELQTRSRTTFKDHDAVLALLRKYNLLAKTLVPTQSSIAALLDDPAVPAEAKAALSKLANVYTQEILNTEKTD